MYVEMVELATEHLNVSVLRFTQGKNVKPVYVIMGIV